MRDGGVSAPLRVHVTVLLAGSAQLLKLQLSLPRLAPRRRVSAAARCVRQGAAVSRSEPAPLPLHHREENTTRWRFRIAALISRRGSARTANFQYKYTNYIQTKIVCTFRKAITGPAMVVKGECLVVLSCFVRW